MWRCVAIDVCEGRVCEEKAGKDVLGRPDGWWLDGSGSGGIERDGRLVSGAESGQGVGGMVVNAEEVAGVMSEASRGARAGPWVRQCREGGDRR